MDIDFQKTSVELVFALIARDNPNLPFALTKDNCILGNPVPIAEDGNFRNTRIYVIPNKDVGYTGPFKVTYRRLNPAILFPSNMGYATIDNFAYPADRDNLGIRIQSALNWVNAKYGTRLIPSDSDRVTVTEQLGLVGVFNFPANNPAWIGTLQWNRLASKEPLDNEIPELTTNISTLSAGVTMSSAVDNIADLLTYGADFSTWSDMLMGLGTLQTLPQTDDMTRLVKYMSLASGMTLSLASAATVKPGLKGCRIIKYNLPNVNVPEANSEDFNAVAVIMPPAGGDCWFRGRFLLHFKF